MFRDQPVAEIAHTAQTLNLTAVQLHGDEDQAYIDTLREALPSGVQIWKALSVKDSIPARDLNRVDRYVLDNGKGGTGHRFDWSTLEGQDLSNVLLAWRVQTLRAGGHSVAQGCFHSGVESEPGTRAEKYRRIRHAAYYAFAMTQKVKDKLISDFLILLRRIGGIVQQICAAGAAGKAFVTPRRPEFQLKLSTAEEPAAADGVR